MRALLGDHAWVVEAMVTIVVRTVPTTPKTAAMTATTTTLVFVVSIALVTLLMRLLLLLIQFLVGLLFADEVGAWVVTSTRVLMSITTEIGGFMRRCIFERRGLLLTTMVLLIVMLVILATRVLPLLQIEVQMMLHPVAIRVVLGAIVVMASAVLVILLLTTSATLILPELGGQTVTCGYAIDGLILCLAAVIR